MIRILLVEDDPVIRDTTSYFLKCQQNFEVVCADTGGEALSHAREKFDVILMDILLPDTNGMDLCQRLRSWHHCPIIFTSCLDFALKKDVSVEPPSYLVFFKGRDVDVMTAAFKEFSAKTVKQKEQPSIRHKLDQEKAQSKAQHKEKVKVKTKDRGAEL